MTGKPAIQTALRFPLPPPAVRLPISENPSPMHIQASAADTTEPWLATILRQRQSFAKPHMEAIVTESDACCSCHNGVFNKDICSDVFYVRATLQGTEVESDNSGTSRNLSKTKHLIAKIIPPDQAAVHDGSAHNREIQFYEVLSEKMKALARAHQLPLGIPDMHYVKRTSKASALVLEDLSVQGYMLLSQHQGLDNEHVTIALKELAVFHAVAFVIKHQCQHHHLIDDFPFLCSADEMPADSSVVLSTQHSGEFLCQMYEADETTSGKETAEWIRTHFLGEEFYQRFRSSRVSREPFGTICHGDLWTNNILFQREREGPTNAVFLDFQFVRYGSLVQDILFFLVTSTTADYWTRNYEDLLALYWQDIKNTFMTLGFENPEPTCGFSFDELVEAFQKNLPFALYSFLFSSVLILRGQITLSENPFMTHTELAARARGLVDELQRQIDDHFVDEL